MVINNVTGNSISKAGLCPHGLVPGACPICSGGGSAIPADRNTRRRPYEMTWNECFAMGQMMKAALERKELAELQHQNAILQNAQMQQTQMQNFIAKMAEILSSIAKNITNNPIAKFTTNVLKNFNNKIIYPIINNISNFIQKFAGTTKNFMSDISDKLAAIFGEETLAKF